MREIKAILQPFMVQHVLDALQELEGLPGVTVSEVRGFGRGGAETSRWSQSPPEHSPKTKLEIVVPDELCDKVVEVIARAARTGKKGDGKIFVLPVLDVVKIRTGEHGTAAI
jgi:nitrogen regulatory protein P-II 1